MKIYMDSCDIDAIKKYSDMGIVDGVTTNPTILARVQQEPRKTIREICDIVKTSVSVEVMATEVDEILQEAESLLDIAPQITIKLPITEKGLLACRILSSKNINVNMTLCFSISQALLAAKAGASYVSLFIGRIDDVGGDGTNLVEEICSMYSNYPNISTKILAASIRHVMHVKRALTNGADVITVSPSLMGQMISNPLTEKGISTFNENWNQRYRKNQI